MLLIICLLFGYYIGTIGTEQDTQVQKRIPPESISNSTNNISNTVTSTTTSASQYYSKLAFDIYTSRLHGYENEIDDFEFSNWLILKNPESENPVPLQSFQFSGDTLQITDMSNQSVVAYQILHFTNKQTVGVKTRINYFELVLCPTGSTKESTLILTDDVYHVVKINDVNNILRLGNANVRLLFIHDNNKGYLDDAKS